MFLRSTCKKSWGLKGLHLGIEEAFLSGCVLGLLLPVIDIVLILNQNSLQSLKEFVPSILIVHWPSAYKLILILVFL